MLLPDPWLQTLALATLALPAFAASVLGFVMLVARAPSEPAIARLVATTFIGALSTCVLTWLGLWSHGRSELVIHLGTWFAVPGYAFHWTLLIDHLSLVMMSLTTAICGLIGWFSVTYMHRDRGYARFFLLLLTFATGMLLLVMSGSVDLMFGGWEVVGLCSVLLIGFFQDRNGPVRNGLRAFITYRVCDVGLLLGSALLHHFAHSADLDVAFGPVHWPIGTAHLGSGPATLIALLFVLAAMGKSAQAPVTGWLPRAMEGPTPSSALFYGALSVHAGAYLLLRMAPVIEAAPLAGWVITGVGAVTAMHSIMVGRVQTDAKSSIAYATATQVGLIFVEIGLGFYALAVVHIVGHACLRTLQLLRAPSALSDARQLHAAAGGSIYQHATRYERMLPESLRAKLYHAALFRFHFDKLLERFVVAPVLRLARLVDRIDRRWTTFIARK